MRRILHIVTSPEDTLASELILRQRQQADQEVRTIDLTAPEPDYRELLIEIFAADSIAVW